MTTEPDQPIRTSVLGRRQLLGAAAALVIAPAAVAVAYGAPAHQATPGATPGTPRATPGTPRATPAGTPSAVAITVEAYEFGFKPNTFTVAVGDTVGFFSSGQEPHDFKIDGVASVDIDFPTDGSTVDWTVPSDLAPGTYTFYCSKPGHREQGMEGEITIS